MKTKIEGVLYGHYDSRGGAIFITSPEGRTPKTDERYTGLFCVEDEYKKELADDDFLGPATIESDEEITNEQDLDFDSDGTPLWVRDFTNGEGGVGKYHLQYGGECPEGYSESELGEDAYGVIVLL
jgi:hypothetical protein